MIAAAHVLGGLISGVVGRSARGTKARIAVAFGLGLLSHVVLDAIPHSDYGSLSRSAVLVVVVFEIAATGALGWYLLRSCHLPGLRASLPAGLIGATVLDAKFAEPVLPDAVARAVQTVGDWLHGPFHAAPVPLALGLSAEITCVALLLGMLMLLVRRQEPIGATHSQ